MEWIANTVVRTTTYTVKTHVHGDTKMKEIHCNNCSICCKSAIWFLSRKEYETGDLKRFLQDCRGFRMVDDVNEKTVKIIMETLPCRNLKQREDGKYECGIYSQRPKVCQEYPKSREEMVPECAYYTAEGAFRHTDKRWYTKGVPDVKGD